MSVIIAGDKVKWVNRYSIMNLFIILATLRYKSLAAVAGFVLFVLYKANKLKKIKIGHVVILALLALFVARQQVLIYYDMRNTYARSVLWINSFKLAIMNFPFGTGPGTFASYYSAVNYSPVYSMLGIDGVQGLSPYYPAFVSDTFWPMVIGQFGFVGLLGYLMMLYWLYTKICSKAVVNSNRYFVGIFILIYMSITSVAESAFLHWNAVMLAIILGIIIRDKRENTYELV